MPGARRAGLTTFPPGQYEVLASVLVQDGSIFKTTWTTVKDAAQVKAGSRGEDIRRPTMIDGEAKFEGVAKALLAFFTVAMAGNWARPRPWTRTCSCSMLRDPIGDRAILWAGTSRAPGLDRGPQDSGRDVVDRELIGGGFCPTQS